MKHVTHMRQLLAGACLLIVSAFSASVASAQVFQTIDVTGSLSQWNGIPTTYSTTLNSGNALPIESVQLANDTNYLYVNVVFFTAVNPQSAGMYLALDNDSNPLTGYDIYGQGTVGSEVGWDNSGNAFQQGAQFNTGAVSGGTLLIGNYSSSVTDQMFAIPLSATFNSTSSSIFPNTSFNLEIYNGFESVDTTGPMAYTLATATPEPSSLVLILGGIVALLAVQRRRRLVSR